MNGYNPGDGCPHGQCGGKLVLRDGWLVCDRCGEFPNDHSGLALSLEYMARRLERERRERGELTTVSAHFARGGW